MSRIQYRDVVSSNIKALGWENGVGYVEFIGGRRFAYKMARADFDAMATAKSVGTHFSRYVKKVCQVVWNGYRCDNSPCTSDATVQGHPGNEKTAVAFRVCGVCAKVPRFTGIDFETIPERQK